MDPSVQLSETGTAPAPAVVRPMLPRPAVVRAVNSNSKQLEEVQKRQEEMKKRQEEAKAKREAEEERQKERKRLSISFNRDPYYLPYDDPSISLGGLKEGELS